MISLVLILIHSSQSCQMQHHYFLCSLIDYSFIWLLWFLG